MVNFDGEKLTQLLKSKLDRLELPYKVKSVASLNDENFGILEENINKHDIVFILNR